jgi:hypothetical protein
MSGYLSGRTSLTTVETADIANNAVNETKLKDALVADFTEVTVTASDSILLGDATDSGNTKRDTVQGVLDLVSAGLTISSEQATTSGSEVTFGSIPTGTKRIHVMLEGVSLNGGNNIELQLGDAGGIETSGYSGCFMRAHGDNTTGIATTDAATIMQSTGAGDTFHGMVTCVLKDASNYTWVMSGTAGDDQNAAPAGFMGFSKTLSAELTQVKVLVSSGTLDAGSVAISYD